MLRKISAHYIFPGQGKPLKRGIVIFDQLGTIVDLIDTGGNLNEIEKLEFYDGIITPGFINAHAHLELSHLKGRIPQHTGLAGFLRGIGQLRDSQVSNQCIIDADQMMKQNGIVAVGDISNSNRSYAVKAVSQISYFTFIELFGIQDDIAKEKMDSGIMLYQQLKSHHLPGSLTPHAPYSMSEALWQLLLDFAVEHRLPWSVHNQECNDENLLFLNKTVSLQNS